MAHELDAPPGGPQSIDPTEGKVEQPSEESFDFTYPMTRYHPLPSLIPPRYVVPGLTLTTYGVMGILATGGTDVLRRYYYSAYVSYRTDGDYLGWGGAFLLNQFLPTFTIGAYSYITPYGDVYIYDGPPDTGGGWVPTVESANAIYWDRRTRVYAQASYDLSTYRTIFLRYEGQYRQPDDPLPAEAYLPLVPTRGFLSSIGGGWRYSKGTSYAKSISPEDAEVISLVGEYTSPYLGSYVLDDNNQEQPFEQFQVTGEVREYRTTPWIPNHVIAAKLAAGASFGDSLRYGSYQLGGFVRRELGLHAARRMARAAGVPALDRGRRLVLSRVARVPPAARVHRPRRAERSRSSRATSPRRRSSTRATRSSRRTGASAASSPHPGGRRRRAARHGDPRLGLGPHRACRLRVRG
jgi:hypothetical protein